MNAIRYYNKGFTLIELLVVIGIISLLSSYVFASVQTSREKARMATAFDSEARVHHISSDMTIGQWEFNECSGTVVRDSSGAGRNGSFVASPAWSTDTPAGDGCSILFSGSSYIQLGNDTAFDVTTDFTIAAWIKPDINSVTSQTILGKTHSSSYYFGFQANRFRFWTNNSLYNPTRVYNIVDGKWHHVVASYEEGIKTIYVDGSLIGKIAGPQPITDTSNLRIGSSSGATNFFLGNMDSVRLYGKGLTAGEVRTLYAESGGRFYLANAE